MKTIPQNSKPRHIAGIFSSSETRLSAGGGTERRNNIHLRIYKDILSSGLLAELRGAPLSVLLAIALYADAEGEAWPSAAKLAENTGYHKRTVQRSLTKLEDLGWIEQQQLRSEDGTWGRRIFTIKDPEAPRDSGSDRANKNRARLSGARLMSPEVVSISEEVTRGEEGARGGSDTEQPSSAESEVAVSLDEDVSSLSAVIKEIKTRLQKPGEAAAKHMKTLSTLENEYGDHLPAIIQFAFDEYFPQEDWLTGKALTWGTIMHCLPDAAAAWSSGTPVYSWTCWKCGREWEKAATDWEDDGPLRTPPRKRWILFCGACGGSTDLEDGTLVKVKWQKDRRSIYDRLLSPGYRTVDEVLAEDDERVGYRTAAEVLKDREERAGNGRPK